MNKILLERFNDFKISCNDILSSIYTDDNNEPIFVYDSHLEGLGTKDSDLDIYVLVNDWCDMEYHREYDNFKVKVVYVNNMALDIEYWRVEYVKDLIDRINNSNNVQISDDELKLLLRLRVGQIINDSAFGFEIKELIDKSKLQLNILKRYSLYANSALEDALNLYNSNEYICSLKCARDALENAIGALNAKHNNINLNPKWIPKIFINNNGYDEKLLDKYLKLQVFTNIEESNISSIVENIIEFSQDIISNVSLID